MKTIHLALALLVTAPAASADSSTLDAAIGGGLGGAAGAAIGNEIGGRDGAIIGGALGGAVGTAIATDDKRNTARMPAPHYRPWAYPYPPYPHHQPGFCPPGQAKKGRC